MINFNAAMPIFSGRVSWLVLQELELINAQRLAGGKMPCEAVEE